MGLEQCRHQNNIVPLGLKSALLKNIVVLCVLGAKFCGSICVKLILVYIFLLPIEF